MRGAFRRWRAALAGLLVIALVLGVYPILVEPNQLVTRRDDLVISEWRGPPLRIAMMSDLHIGSLFMNVAKAREVALRMQAEQPDLVVLLGDYVRHGERPADLQGWRRAASLFGDLRPKYGVFAVMGNHDCWANVDAIRQALVDAHVTVLENKAVRVSNGPEPFWIWGLADLWEQQVDYTGPLAAIPKDESVIALTHNPDSFPAIDPRVPLTLAGHTHGGQIALPIVGRPHVPSAYGQRYAVGHVTENGHHLFVTSGVGTSILPIRLGVPPEIAIVTLRAK